MPDRIARINGETRAVLIVVFHERGVDADRLSRKDGGLLGLVEAIAAGKNRKARGDRPVKEIRFRESEHDASLNVAGLCRKRERFAETEEVVGLVGQSNEGAGNTADAALQPDGLFPAERSTAFLR